MSVSSIINILNELNKTTLRELLASITLFYSMSSINYVMNLNNCNIYLSHTQNKGCLKRKKKKSFFIVAPIWCNVNIQCAFTLCLYYSRSITSKYIHDCAMPLSLSRKIGRFM
jgi:hypothetical protein